MIYMYIDLQIFTTIWLGIKLIKKLNLINPIHVCRFVHIWIWM
jgi:hypothetical protein